MSGSALDLLTLLQIPGIGSKAAIQLGQDRAGTQRDEAWTRARRVAERIERECADLGIGMAGWFDSEFPERLREIPDPPAVVFYRGDLNVARRPVSAAVVGTRDPSPWGTSATRAITKALAADGWTIVSGLALGIDTVAHQTALEEGAPTIAILGNGLGAVYPAANRGLADAILSAGGLLLAEVPPRTRVEPRALVRRDRLQSGLSAITIICQAGRDSGAMHTARYAYQQQRPLFCAAMSRRTEPAGEENAGTRALLELPARHLPEVLPAWKRARKASLGHEPAALPLDEEALTRLREPHPSAPPARLF